MAVWPVSGILARQVAFQTRLRNYTVPHGEEAQQYRMNQHGESGPTGVVKGMSIPFQVSIYNLVEYLHCTVPGGQGT